MKRERLYIHLAALFFAACVIAAPLFAARYPLMIDLPQHAANAAVLRHHGDAQWHFREQFELQPLAVPYLSYYLLAAFFMLALPPLVAVKVALAATLALLPFGLATLSWGMRKSPLLGLWGLVLV